MKKLILLVSAFVTLFSVDATSQKGFKKGTITYEIDMDASGPQADMIKMVVNASTIALVMDGDQSKLDLSVMNGLAAKMSFFGAGKNMKMLYDIPMQNEKGLVRLSQPENGDNLASDSLKTQVNAMMGMMKPNIKQVKGTKKIAGYKCKKAELSLLAYKATIYYTKAINVPAYQNLFKGIGGFPLYMEVDLGEMKIVIKAKDIDKTAPDSDSFNIPEGYPEMSMEEFTKNIQGMAKKPMGM